MKKGKNFVGRLFRRNATPATDEVTPLSAGGLTIQIGDGEKLGMDEMGDDTERFGIGSDASAEIVESGIEEPETDAARGVTTGMDDDTDSFSMEEDEEDTSGPPTLCKGGKLYRARLRNGRWETIGPPIGDC